MSNQLQDKRLIELLHDCTQKGYRLTFSADFEGMLTVGYEDEFPVGEYNHVHIGSLSDPSHTKLESQLINFLVGLLEK